ncbi:MAG TPA: HAD-IB family phosphatase [bacterium]
MMIRSSPYKVIFFDNDGTLTTSPATWNYIHQHFGTWEPEARELLQHHLRNRTPYDEFCRDSVALLKGFPKSGFIEKLMSIETRDGAREVYHEIRKTGLKIAVLSSGMSLWREVWKQKEGFDFDHYHANDIVFDNEGNCAGEIVMNVTDNVAGMDKGDRVERISEIEGIGRDERIFIGDGWGDVRGFRKCALGVGIDPDDETRVEADIVLESNEFKKVLDIIFPE